MCGRFALHLNADNVQQLQGYNVRVGNWVDRDAYVPRYNIAPHTHAPVIRRQNAAGSSNDSEMVIQSMKWGLVPHWSKHEDKNLNTTNARSENLIEGGGMWGSIKGKKRCAVICEGYYEWLTKGKEKLPHFTKLKNGNLMLMAGLYDSVILEGQTEPLWTFSIVTTEANQQMSWLHERMPVILTTEEELNNWLDTSSQQWTQSLADIVKPYKNQAGPLECYQVPKEVGRVGTESSTYIEPVATRKDGIQAMFSRQKQQQASKSSGSPEKRKREASPKPSTSQSSREDDDDVVVLDAPPVKKMKVEPKSPSKSPKKRKAVEPVKGKGAITSFFGKT